MAVSGVVAVNLDENNEKTKKKVKGDEMTHLLAFIFCGQP